MEGDPRGDKSDPIVGSLLDPPFGGSCGPFLEPRGPVFWLRAAAGSDVTYLAPKGPPTERTRCPRLPGEGLSSGGSSSEADSGLPGGVNGARRRLQTRPPS